MRRIHVTRLGIVFALAAWLPGAAAGQDEAASPALEQRLLSGVRQLTFEGRRAGEGYFSADGRRMVFQSEREPGNPFYQIYLLDLENGDTQRISPGHGKTTCAWIHPDGRRILFASTHDDAAARTKQQDELTLRESAQQRRYEWDYDEHFELYAWDLPTRQSTRLTSARGYDAEGSYSPDGQWIAFSSNRHAYAEPLSETDAKAFELDKSLLIDIYIMRADGSDLRRLTHARGYDGGPFFSPDGKRICWRRFSEDGATAEVFTINVDGSDPRQLTSIGAMSWAPFYHPSGEYLIFTTNRHGFANFELYLVDVGGKREPVRVTHTSGFDGLPVFAPDGKQLAWTATRTPGRNAQIFLAGWNHAAAQELLRDAPPRATAPTAAPSAAPAGAAAATPSSSAISTADLRRHVETLASEAMDGRLTGTEGELRATEYVAQQFARIGLAPGGVDGGWYQPFPFTAGVALGADNKLTITAGADQTKATLDADWRPLAFSQTGEIAEGEVVFVGYGIVAPADGEQPAYDAYTDLDVTGKWVLALRYMPENIAPQRRQHLTRYASLRYKAMLARERGAKGLLIASGPTSAVREPLIALDRDASMAGTSIAAASISDALAEKLLSGAGQTLRAWQEALDSGDHVPGKLLPGARAGAHIDIRRVEKQGRNVLAVLRSMVAAPRAALVIGAHVDHLGRGGSSNSLAKPEERDQIHFGADDNASGVAALLELAEHLKAESDAGRLPLTRDMIFAAWSGEELGLLGSRYFVDQLDPQGSPGESLRGRVCANLNMDMIGRLGQTLTVQGVGSSSFWRGEIERRNAPLGLSLSLSDDAYLPTDATSFYLRGIPVLSFFSGAHDAYHTPRDTPDTLNYEGMAQVTRLVALLARGLASSRDQPDFVELAKPKTMGQRAGLRAYLGTIPDYADPPIPGLRLSGVATGGPAHAAGVRGGDIIVELAGRKVENIHDYTFALDGLRPGEATTIVVVRDGQRLRLPLTPGSRE